MLQMAWQMVLQPGYEPSMVLDSLKFFWNQYGGWFFNLQPRFFFGENLENLIKSNKEIHVQLVNDILGGLLNLFLPRCYESLFMTHVFAFSFVNPRF